MKLSKAILIAIVVITFSQTQASAGKFSEIMERLKKPMMGKHFLPRFKLVVHEYEEFVPGQNNKTVSNEITTVTEKCCNPTAGDSQAGSSHKGCDYCDGSGCSICDIRVDSQLEKFRKHKGESYYPSRAPICESNFGFYHTCWRKLPPVPDACRTPCKQPPEPTTAEPQKVYDLPTDEVNRTDALPVIDTEQLKHETQTLEYYPPKTASNRREK